jgi:HNH endonuclease/CENP-B N-terminal DNA-binding domain
VTKRRCAVEGCDGVWHSRGFCHRHYKRNLDHGTPLGGKAARYDTEAAVAQALASTTDDCILWPYSTNWGGYGIFFSAHGQTASVYVCTEAHGPRPAPGHQVRHLCGVSGCVNPRHLIWGTVKENHADKVGHGTAPKGERNPRAKLTDEQVLEIERRHHAGERGTELAREFDVSSTAVYSISKHKTWRHLW